MSRARKAQLPGRYRAVVFDMDGLLLDTERLWLRAERRLLARYGYTFTDADALASIGRGFEESVADYTARAGLPPERAPGLRAELLELVRAEFESGLAGRPGAMELVRRLRGRVPLALASNTPRALVEFALDTAGIREAFDAVVSAQDVARPKPAPDIYLAACEALGVAPRDALALEDSPAGVLAAREAGLDVIAVPLSAEIDVSAAHQVLESLEDLL
ncbi:MAG TPA: HAD family phosphatase [Candidatus Limnocylindrales bacterium]|nr:HAD family phosphatase [Candidatus Limnocylindrales bacterium]